MYGKMIQLKPPNKCLGLSNAFKIKLIKIPYRAVKRFHLHGPVMTQKPTYTCEGYGLTWL